MSKGQAILLDFVFAAFIFSIVFAAIMLSLRNIQDNLDYEEKVWRIQHAAIPAVDILVKSGGVPVDWELNPAKARIPALAGTGYGLSPVKVAALNNLDYEFKKLKPAWLDKSYLRLPWWPHVKPVILHPGLPMAGGGRSPLPERNNKKRFYTEHCRKKSIPFYFPSDYIIDTERRLLLKIQNSQVIDVQEIQQEFWIYQEHE